MKRKTIGFLLMLFLFSVGAASAQTGIVKGTVVDPEGTPLPGVTVQIKGKNNGAATSIDGKYALANVSSNDEIEFIYLGFEKQTIKAGNQKEIDVIMKEDATELEEVTVVAFQKQKKESVIASVTTISPKDLKVPSSNLTTAFAGKLSGVIAYQRSGEPGQDNADFFIRGVTTFGYKSSPLILIDGLEVTNEDLARLDPDNVATFSIMKDATATALYGARGANGVILVTTKTGKKGKMSISVRAETQISTPTKVNQFLDGVSYMEMYNEAQRMRSQDIALGYSKEKIEATRRGENPDIYPNVDWYKELFSDYAQNYKLNVSATGGGDVAQYYLSVAYTNERGVLKVDPLNNFNNNIAIQRFNIRGNIDFNFTKTTKGALKMYQLYDIYNGPIGEASDIFNAVMWANPVDFPKTYNKNVGYAKEFVFVKHTLFGSMMDSGRGVNPYAQMVSGYKDRFSSTNQAQFSVEQDLGMLTSGLKLRALVATNIYARNTVSRSFAPFYYAMNSQETQMGVIHTLRFANKGGSETLGNPSIQNYTYSSLYGESAMQYDRVFKEKHTVGGLLVATIRQGLNEYMKEKDPPATIDYAIVTLPARNVGFAGRLSYSFDNRYFIEGNFGYTGSEKFAKKNQFQFFPSFGLGWNITGEHFYPESWKKAVNLLKLKYTRGKVGNDEISAPWDRFYYLSDVSGNGPGYAWGSNTRVGYNGYIVNRYANEEISWDRSLKTNYGVELGLFEKLNLQVDYYTDLRSGIYETNEYVPSTMGLTTSIKSNIGVQDNKGIDISADFEWIAKRDFWLTSRFNFTYAHGVVIENGEPDYHYDYQSKLHYSPNQPFGYVAERLFTDYDDIRNSPAQFVGKESLKYNEEDPYTPGDIKYVDINKDGIINSNDIVAIGYPAVPEIIYGFGASTGYKAFDFSFFFQGSGRSSFFIDPENIAPFISNRNALTIIADNHWSYDNPDPHAFWPRMSVASVANNNVPSTWWLRDGSFLRLKTVEAGFSLKERITRKWGISSFRLYVSATNLFTVSSFNLWDIEMSGKGLGYPVQRVFNAGLQFTF
ncbi:MAG: TonB-dependent receptor [Dysgonamonadaceae bacterium]|jgi:TonB-linked SusC/RagA family outer membrane protein|nr:TonB-dependent receptor [Dysgonamonadaceae bacterium]